MWRRRTGYQTVRSLPAFATTLFLSRSQSPFPSRLTFCSHMSVVIRGALRLWPREAAEPPLELPAQEGNEPHSTHKSLLATFTSKQRNRLRHAMNTALGSPLQSFSLFGRGDAAVHLPAGLVERPLIRFGTRVGAVPCAKALLLPVPCEGGERGGL